MQTVFRLFFIIFILAQATCSVTEVKPWEKKVLALPAMEMGKASTSESLQGRFYFSREASSGGSGSAVSGCGCN